MQKDYRARLKGLEAMQKVGEQLLRIQLVEDIVVV
jgi:hypothetical protein